MSVQEAGAFESGQLPCAVRQQVPRNTELYKLMTTKFGEV